MPLDLAAALRRHLLQRFPADRDYPRAALHAEGMPPLIAAFLDRTLDRWVEIERAQLHSDWFDFARPEVQQAEARFFDALARTARIPAEAWKGTLGGTVDLIVRYLTTPARALTDAIFEGSADPLSAAEVRARLPMFDAYPYFAEIAGAYLEKKRTDTLEPPDLFGLLDRIDRRVVSEYGPDDWLDLLAPLFDLARYVPEFDGVPASLLKRFFEMKGEPDLAVRVGKHVGEALDAATLGALLTPNVPAAAPGESAAELVAHPARINGHAIAEAPPPVPHDEPEAGEPEDVDDAQDVETFTPDEIEFVPAGEGTLPGEAPTVEAKSDVEDERAGIEEESEPAVPEPVAAHAGAEADAEPEGSDDDEAVPLWQRFAHDADRDNVNARFGSGEPAETLVESAEEAGAGEDDAPPLWKRFFSRSDDKPSPLPPPPASEAPRPASEPSRAAPARANSLEELERRVLGASTSGQRTRFVKHLFAGDAGKYATVLHTLDAAGSWTEASQIIARDVFRPFRVNIYSDHAVAFTDAVEARFRT